MSWFSTNSAIGSPLLVHAQPSRTHPTAIRILTDFGELIVGRLAQAERLIKYRPLAAVDAK
jgi:hypothetical protein